MHGVSSSAITHGSGRQNRVSATDAARRPRHPDGIKDALDLYSAYRLCYVGVHCDLETLERRVTTRPNKRKAPHLQVLSRDRELAESSRTPGRPRRPLGEISKS